MWNFVMSFKSRELSRVLLKYYYFLSMRSGEDACYSVYLVSDVISYLYVIAIKLNTYKSDSKLILLGRQMPYNALIAWFRVFLFWSRIVRFYFWAVPQWPQEAAIDWHTLADNYVPPRVVGALFNKVLEYVRIAIGEQEVKTRSNARQIKTNTLRLYGSPSQITSNAAYITQGTTT